MYKHTSVCMFVNMYVYKEEISQQGKIQRFSLKRFATKAEICN